jgi:pyruvate ferredoxin oxidoreductase gamma subunit
VAVLDETILDSQDVTKNLTKNEALIVNTRKTADEIREKLKNKGKKFEGKIHTIDANGISMEVIGQLRPNTVILGKLVQISEIIYLDSVIEEFRRIFEEKIGEDSTEKNIQAIEKAYDSI